MDGGREEGAAGDAGPPRRLPRSWAEAFPPRPRPEGVDYGFLSTRGEPVASTREDLEHLARTRALPPLAWAPETAEMVPPWELPIVLQAFREGAAARVRRELRLTLAGSAVLVLAFWLLTPPPLATGLTVGVGALLGMLVASMRRRVRRAERLSADQVRAGFDALIAQQVEAAQPAPATRALALAVAAVGVSQLFLFSASIQAGALRADAVAAGEWWRLLTAPMLHGHVLHFWMNYAALQSLGRTIETRGVGAWVPLVFVVSALAGGAASLALPPDVVSVGASGGLMGMFGFLAVMAYRRTRHLPAGFLRALLINIALIGVLGAVAYRFIDNAAHAGGLAAGVVLGFAAIPDGGRVPAWKAGPMLRRAGRAATWLLWLSAAAAIGLTLRAGSADADRAERILPRGRCDGEARGSSSTRHLRAALVFAGPGDETRRPAPPFGCTPHLTRRMFSPNSLRENAVHP
jgi:membrane associated rhomboid family serine protease